MDLNDYLETVTLMNCTGQVTHELTLQIDGTVMVKMGSVDVIVDPSTRQHRPPSLQLGRGDYGHDAVIEVACSLARGG